MRQILKCLKNLKPGLFFFCKLPGYSLAVFPSRPFLADFCAEPFPQLYSLKLFWNRTQKSMKQEEWINHQLALYDAEEAYLDQQLGELFESLKAVGAV